MKTFKGVIKIIVIVAIVTVMGLSSKVQATELSKSAELSEPTELLQNEPLKVAGLSEIINAGKFFIQEGKDGSSEMGLGDEESFAEQLAPIGSIIAGIGVIIFMAVLGIMAIKWIVAKPEDKAKLKQAFVGYVIAAVVFFGAVGIWRLAKSIMNDVENSIASSSTIIIAKK